MTTDLAFITNGENRNPLERFRVLIKDTSLFDCLVVYFYSSGFYRPYPSLESTESTPILIGFSTDKHFGNFQQIRLGSPLPMEFSLKDEKNRFSVRVAKKLKYY
jgi:hypothetical protein